MIYKTVLAGAMTLVRVAFGKVAGQIGLTPRRAHVTASIGASAGGIILDAWVGAGDGVLALGDVKVEVRLVDDTYSLVVANVAWEYTIVPGSHRLVNGGSIRHTHVDVSVVALTDPLAAPVAPHGLIGQGKRNMSLYLPSLGHLLFCARVDSVPLCVYICAAP